MKSTYEYFTHKMLMAILARWPDWKKHLKTPREFRSKGFWIEVPAPNKNLTRGLSVVTDHRMIVIGLDDDHDHLLQRKSESLPQFRARVIARITDILEGKIFAISWRDRDGHLRTSNCFDPGGGVRNQFVQSGYTRRIRSWSGQHDEDFIET